MLKNSRCLSRDHHSINKRRDYSPKLLSATGWSGFFLGIGFIAFWCCKPHRSSESMVEHFIENQILWALGQVDLADSPQLPDIYIKKIQASSGPPLNRSGGVQTLVGYQLVGQSAGDEKALAIVDYHPSDEKLLAYTYTLQVAPISPESWVLYAKLYKTPKKAQRNLLILGQIAGSLEGEMVKIQLGNQWHRSMIARGPLLGSWALHVPEVRHIEVKPWVGICPRDQDLLSRGTASDQRPRQGQLPPTQGTVQGGVTQLGSAPPQQPVGQTSQSPLQGPSQADSCRLLQIDNDLCGGDPFQNGCTPLYDIQVNQMFQEQQINFGRAESFEQLQPIEGQQFGFQLAPGVHQGKFFIKFQGLKIEKDEDNDRICRLGTLVTARTLGGQLNPACRISILPSMAPAVSGGAKMLRCGYQIDFLSPQSYLEKICQLSFQIRIPTLGSQNPKEKQIEEQTHWSALQVIHH
jgi:hypothetical protein